MIELFDLLNAYLFRGWCLNLPKTWQSLLLQVERSMLFCFPAWILGSGRKLTCQGIASCNLFSATVNIRWSSGVSLNHYYQFRCNPALGTARLLTCGVWIFGNIDYWFVSVPGNHLRRWICPLFTRNSAFYQCWSFGFYFSGLQVYYLSSTNADGRDDHCEQLGWKKLQEYNPDQRCWKYLSTLAEGNTMLESNLPFEDELEDEDYYPSLPFAALFSCLKVFFFL